MELYDELLSLCRAFPGESSFLLKTLRGPEAAFAYQGDKRMVSASTIKVGILLYYAQLMMEGRIGKETLLPVKPEDVLCDCTVMTADTRQMSLHDLLYWMITLSDNTSTNILMDHAGMETINGYLRSLGLAQATLQRKMLDFDAVARGFNNYICAQDSLRMFKLLYAEEILTPQLCRYCLDILSAGPNADCFEGGIPEDVRCAHKPGGLDGLRHDAGIFFLKERDYFFGIYADKSPDDETAIALVRKAGQMVLRAMSA